MNPSLEVVADSPLPQTGTGGEGPPAEAPRPRRGEGIRRLAIWIALYAIPVIVVVRPVLDFDIWWHLATGRWILEHGTVPLTDPFSDYGQGQRWIAYSWLFEVLVYGLYQGLGLYGIILYRVLLAVAIVAAVHRLVSRREPRFVRANGLAGLALIALLPLLQERTWLFSILFYTLTLDVVLDLREGRPNRFTWLLPLCYALWANVHVQFMNGLFLLGLACAAPVLEWLLGQDVPPDSGDAVGSRTWWRLVGLTALCTAATLLNPYHWRLYIAVIELPTQTGAFKAVQELQSMAFRSPWEWVVLALTALAAYTLGKRSRLSVFEVLLLGTGAYFSFRAQRDLWLVVLAAFAILVTGRRTAGVQPDVFPPTFGRVLVVAGAVVVAAFLTLVGRELTPEALQKKVAETFPVDAVAFVEDRNYPGPLYNHYNWGGFLIWNLPRLQVSMDGRANLQGDERMDRADATWRGSPCWAEDPELLAANVIIAHQGIPLVTVLRLDGRFHQVYEDKVAVVFVAEDVTGGR